MHGLFDALLLPSVPEAQLHLALAGALANAVRLDLALNEWHCLIHAWNLD